jgi:hypothetical protein
MGYSNNKGRRMKITLNKNELFWSLINPEDLEDVRMVLNEKEPQVEVNFKEQPKWVQSQIFNSVSAGRISTDTDLVENKPAAIKTNTKTPPAAKAPKKVSKTKNIQ